MSNSNTSFGCFKLNNWIVKRCASIGVKVPTPIQLNCIPEILNGRNCIGAAKTGSGKTLAFALPMIQKLCEDPYGIFALVLTPTRELAYQIADQFAIIGKPINLKQCVIVGGMDMVEQGLQLSRRPHIVVATPGRLADHLESCKTFTLSRIKFLVLDEADTLISGQFSEQLDTIMAHLPKKDQRQNLFFSATITDTLKALKEIGGEKCFLYEAPSETATVDQLEQRYVLCPVDVKDAYFVQTVREYRQKNETSSIVIFTSTCKNCEILSRTLNDVGFENVALHGMLAQKKRLAALTKFKNRNVRILLATDVAGRGLDISNVDLVINHTIPKTTKEYIHRVGRTARAGRGGQAFTIVTPYDIKTLLAIEREINTKMTELKVDEKAVCEICTQIYVTKAEASLQLDEENFFEKTLTNKKKKWILQGLDPDKETKKMLKKNKRKKTKKTEKKEKQDKNEKQETVSNVEEK